MTDITIPPAALEAAAKDLYEAWCRVHGVADTALPWEDIDNEERDACFTEARAACLAMLEAWPWKKHGIHHRHDVSIPFVMLSMAEVPNDND